MTKPHQTPQVASGRFGVTAEYLANADELQIKWLWPNFKTCGAVKNVQKLMNFAHAMLKWGNVIARTVFANVVWYNFPSSCHTCKWRVAGCDTNWGTLLSAFE